MDRLSEAIIYATNHFANKTRKLENFPAIIHSLEVASIALNITSDVDIAIAGVLHDTVEDAGATLEEIEKLFGNRVKVLVESETENKRRDIPSSDSWLIRKQESIEILKSTNDLGIKALYLSDKLSNVRSLYRCYSSLHNDLWKHFNQKDPLLHKWYYESIAQYTKEYEHTSEYREYVEIITNLFKEN